MTASNRPPNQFLQLLDADDYDALRPYLGTIEMVRETILSEEGAPLRHVCFPHDGAVSITVGLAQGQTIEVAMLGRDSVIGAGAALADGIAPANALVLFPGSASVVSIAAFLAMADRSARFRELAIRHEQAKLVRVQRSLLCNTLHPVEARLARWLLRAHDLCGREALLLTQELLAQMIGVRRNAISIVAHSLQRAGVIRYNRGRIEITDRQALTATACDCYLAVNLQCQRLLTVSR